MAILVTIDKWMQKKMPSGVDWAGGMFNHFSASLVLRGTGTYVLDNGTTMPLPIYPVTNNTSPF